MTRCLNLRPWEAAAMAAGRVREIWRPIKPQPVVPDGATGPHVNSLGCWYWLVYPGTPMQFACSDRLPVLCGSHDKFSRQFIKPGTILACRERFAWVGGKIHFEADGEDRLPYKSPTRMPADLARFRPVVASCEPRQARSITEAEAKAAGCWGTGASDEGGDSGALPLYSAVFRRQWQEAYPGATWAWRVVLEVK